MADIFMAYARADQEIVHNIIRLLRTQDWTVWWDVRLSVGERWDDVTEREINIARCVVVVWTPQSISRYWVNVEANHGRERGILVPVLIGCEKPPFAFSLIHSRDLSGWDGQTSTPASKGLLMDVRRRLESKANSPPQPQFGLSPTDDARTGADAPTDSNPQEKLNHTDSTLISSSPPNPTDTDEASHTAEAEPQAPLQNLPIQVQVGTGPQATCQLVTAGGGKAAWFKDIPTGPEMVVVPAGNFQMGSPKEEMGRTLHEGPQQNVYISAPFAVSRFAISFAEWDAAVADGGCSGYLPEDRWGRDDQPMIYVSWIHAKAYVGWLSAKTGRSYRLLSEAEWEYVARAESDTPFWWGSSIGAALANYNGSFTYAVWPKDENRKRTVPVSRFEPNSWGLYQVHGNVWEWCEDEWSDNYYYASPDGSFHTKKKSVLARLIEIFSAARPTKRVIRGGSWASGPNFVRSAARGGAYPSFRNDRIGFRVARSIDE